MNRFLQKAAPFIMLAGGIFFLVLGFVNLKQMKTFVEVPAVVSRVDGEDTYDADGAHQEITIYVQYRVAGQAYEEPLSFTKTNLNEGDEIIVRYNPDNPKEVSGASKGGAALYFVFGGLITLAGAATLIRSLVRRV